MYLYKNRKLYFVRNVSSKPSRHMYHRFVYAARRRKVIVYFSAESPRLNLFPLAIDPRI